MMADFQAIITQANGLLEADNNVQVLAPPNSNVGNSNSEGVSAFLSRADHQHVVQGVENVTTLPTTGNFLGRLVYVTSGVNIGKLMACTNVGANTFVTWGGSVASTEVAVHAAEHKDGGHDPLADNTITDHMKASRTTYLATIAADVTTISTSTYTTIVDLPVTTNGVQTLHVIVSARAVNTNVSNKPSFAFRVQDTTAGGTPTIWRSQAHQLGVSTGGSDSAYLCYSFFYTVPATGARTLRLQAGCTIAAVDIKANAAGFNGDTTNVIPTLQAVVV